MSEPGAGNAGKAALDLLRGGNARFLDAIARTADPDRTRASLAAADPYAVVLGCSDSRVPPEVVFNESVGRLFVVRVAANIAGPAEVASIEYAVARWNCPLVVVLGHSLCGGVGAALGLDDAQLAIGAETSLSIDLAGHLGSVRSNVGRELSPDARDPWLRAARANVRRVVDGLLTWSPIVGRRASSGRLEVVGAFYDVFTGSVELPIAPD